MSSTNEPEQYPVRPTPHCPNSVFPVLVYRGVLPTPVDEESTSDFLQRNHWEKKATTPNEKGTWGAITTKHFHPNTHECYGVIHGRSELVFGLGGADAVKADADADDSNGEGEEGVRVTVAAGDVVVVPAGVAHASVRKDDGYRYIGVYPEGSPKWRNEWGKRELSGADDPLFDEIKGVRVPRCDPVFGAEGPLRRVWNGILAEQPAE
ncbi:hypothetical protein SLS58_005099 [Diplodia intermedia]|uniref:Cupin type-1 domain-containing protein n=1 Tax=Diplodia intermedia TaxID=856260 RepID=A0ABR3TSH1_9PEZI